MDLSKEEKNKLHSFFTNFKETIADSHKNWQRNTNSDVLIVDGSNTFLRAWSANPTMDDNGNHTGGIVGCLKSIGYAIKLLVPTRCIVVFDGIGGSFKRKQIFPNYKERRKGKLRLNRTYEEMTDITTEEESCRKQYIRTLTYLQTLPVNLLSVDHVEADDVIAYLALQEFKDSRKVFIMSADKDFLQLCSNNISVYSPTKKRIYGIPEVINEYQIHPNNFVLARSIDGDKSDNIDGIEGAGIKTIVKHFPWLNEEKIHTIDEIITHADGLKNKYKVCERIINGKALLERNYALMQLKDTYLTTIAQLHCNDRMKPVNIPKLDRGTFIKLIRDDVLNNNFFNHVNWVNECFNPLDSVTRSE